MNRRQKIFLKKLSELCKKTKYSIQGGVVRCTETGKEVMDLVMINTGDVDIEAIVEDNFISHKSEG